MIYNTTVLITFLSDVMRELVVIVETVYLQILGKTNTYVFILSYSLSSHSLNVLRRTICIYRVAINQAVLQRLAWKLNQLSEPEKRKI